MDDPFVPRESEQKCTAVDVRHYNLSIVRYCLRNSRFAFLAFALNYSLNHTSPTEYLVFKASAASTVLVGSREAFKR